MLCEVAHIAQGRASQRALDLVDISVAYFCRISFQVLLVCCFVLKNNLYIYKNVSTLMTRPLNCYVSLLWVLETY